MGETMLIHYETDSCLGRIEQQAKGPSIYQRQLECKIVVRERHSPSQIVHTDPSDPTCAQSLPVSCHIAEWTLWLAMRHASGIHSLCRQATCPPAHGDV